MSEVKVGAGLIGRLGQTLLDSGLAGRAFVVTDERVAEIYGQKARDGLADVGVEGSFLALPTGETTKSLATAFEVYDWLAESRAERRDTVVALGGGVVGDLAGFVAATYLRGLALAQAPTTLLAQIDSSIGGKVAVNHPKGKNLVGAFYPANLVVADTELLLTLHPRQLASGWAEVVKTALIRDGDMLADLERLSDKLKKPDVDEATRVIRRSIQHKLDVVAEDPKEAGIRITLNYGHTIGHAIETATRYSVYAHGEAVAIGMVGAAEIACRLGVLDPAIARRQKDCLERYGLPTCHRKGPNGDLDVDLVIDSIGMDKKVSGKAVRWVLLTDVGHTTVRNDVPISMVRDVVQGLVE